MVDFGKLTNSNLDRIKKAAENVQNAQMGSSTAPSSRTSIFSSALKDGINLSDFENKDFTEVISGKKMDELSSLEKSQYELVSAMADQDGDGKISQKEIGGFDVSGDGIIDISDLSEILNIGTDASIEELLNSVDSILNDQNIEEPEIVTDGTTPAKNSGAVYNEKTGKYEITIEDYRDGRVQDDGNNGKRYPNGSHWGIATNAYPDMSESDKMKYINDFAKANGYNSYEEMSLHTGEKYELPVAKFDENGKYISPADVAIKPAEEKTASAAPSSTTAATTTTTPKSTTTATKSSVPSSTTTSSASKQTTSSATSSEYDSWLKNLNYTFDSCAGQYDRDNNYDQLFAYAEDCFNNNKLSNTEKTKLFDQMMNRMIDQANPEWGCSENNLPYDFLRKFGDSGFMTKEHEADTLMKLMNNSNLNVGLDYLNYNITYDTMDLMDELTSSGNIDKAIALEKTFNANFATGGVSPLSEKIGEHWARYTADLYTQAAKQGRLGEISSMEEFAPFKGIQDKVSGGTETDILDGLFNNLSKNLPSETNLNDADKAFLEKSYLSGNLESNINTIYKSSLSTEQKAYLMNKLMSSDDFTSKFRSIGGLFGKSAQEPAFQKIIEMVAEYTG